MKTLHAIICLVCVIFVTSVSSKQGWVESVDLSSLPTELKNDVDVKDFADSIINIEGGYVDNKYDNGGKTKYGITAYVAKLHGYDNVNKLTKKQASDIMITGFWEGCRIKSIYDAGYKKLAYFMFDFSINAGYNAIEELQEELGVEPDKNIGTITLTAISKYDEDTMLENMKHRRSSYYKSLDDYKHFGNGWQKRNEEIYNICMNI